MKKLIKILIFSFFAFIPFAVNAAGGLSVSSSYLDLPVGSTQSINVCLNNAAGRVDFSSSGVINISSLSEFLDSGCATIYITGNGNGSGSIGINVVDGTTYDDEDITGQSFYVTVNVFTPSSNNNNNSYSENTLSSDTTLSSVSVSSYDVTKDGDNYLTSVPYDTDKVEITATPRDYRSTVTGTGEKTLVPGENKFTLTVTASDGSTSTYYVIITRKTDYFELSYIDEALKLDIDPINIKLVNTDVLTVDILDKIKNSNKNVNLFMFDDENSILYEWLINNKTLDYTGKFNPILILNIENKEDILSKINYVESIIFKVQSSVPSGVTLRYNTSSKYKNGDKLLAYKFNDNEVTLTTSENDAKNFNVSDSGFYDLNPESEGIYIISKGNLMSNSSPVKTNGHNYLWLVITEGVVILGLTCLLVYKLFLRNPEKALVGADSKKNKKEPKFNKNEGKIEFMVPGVVPPEAILEETSNIHYFEEKEVVQEPINNEDNVDVKSDNVTETISVDNSISSDDMPAIKKENIEQESNTNENEVSDVILANTNAGENMETVKVDTVDDNNNQTETENK